MSDSRFVLVGVILGASSMVACTAFSDTYISSRENQQVSGDSADAGTSTPSSTTAGTGAAACSGSFTKPDISKLTACGNGKGHCFPKGQVPLAGQLAACPDAKDVCVPDEILEAGGDKLKSCKSIGAGACLTGTLFPELVAQGGVNALPKDVCDDGQLCLPCVDPRNNASTGLCDAMGVMATDSCASSTPAADAGAAPAATPCCTTNGKSNGVCINEAAIPEAQRSQAPSDTCSTGNKCVPASFVAGKPVACDGGLLGKGVCMDKCFNEMLGFAGSIGILSSDGCGSSTELCIPCSFLSGKGVPGCQ